MGKSKSKGAQAAIPYARRVVEDEYVQAQLRSALASLRDVYRRISRQQADAAADRKLYRNLRRAAVSIRKAVARVEEPPPRPWWRGPQALGIALSVLAALLLLKRARGGDADLALEVDAAAYDGEPAVSQPSSAQSQAGTAT